MAYPKGHTMCNRCTSSRQSQPSSGDAVTAPTPKFEPPRRWTPDPVSRTGALFYAFAGAALWEGAAYAAHHIHVVITLA